MPDKIENIEDLRHWVKLQVVIKRTSQEKIAQQMGIAPARISEALHGKPWSKKYIEPLVKELGGDIEDFKTVI